jgi:hypothetical protein
MKAHTEIANETVAPRRRAAPLPYWGSALLLASMASWAVIIEAARLIAAF